MPKLILPRHCLRSQPGPCGYATSRLAHGRHVSAHRRSISARTLTVCGNPNTTRRSKSGGDTTRVCYPARIGYSSVRTPGTITAAVSLAGWHADVAQLVEHHLAKVRVAGSNPVVRSETPNAVGADPRLSGSMVSLLRWSFGRWKSFRGGVAEWFRQGPAKPCTRVRFPSPPLFPVLGLRRVMWVDRRGGRGRLA
jgi:hypothetical protein